MRKPMTSGAAAAWSWAAVSAAAVLFAVGCGSSTPARGPSGTGGTGTGGANTGGSGAQAGLGGGRTAGGGSGGQVSLPDAGAFCSSQPAAACAQGGCAAPPSCAIAGSGRTDCGSNKESCCTSPEVPCGAYFRTYTNDGTGATDEDAPALVSGFRLDKYLVTVGRFRQFVQAWNGGSGYTPAAGSGKHAHLNGGKGLVDAGGSPDGGAAAYEPGWLASDDSNLLLTNADLACDPTYATWTPAPGSNENLPMNCVSWYEAYAFCIWDGGFLPSEAEFEYAAAGGSQQREYPWGSNDPAASSGYAIFGCARGTDGGGCTGLGNLAPVGTAVMGAARWGQLDLAGNVSEWNLDVYAPFATPCTDCTALSGGSGRVNRAGSFRSTSVYLQASFRGDLLYATDKTSAFGIRCARKP
jgi:sulfatase modifying factor 1